MTETTFDRLGAMAAHVGTFGRRLNWELQGRAVVSWEFSSMQAWAAARHDLLDQLLSDPKYHLLTAGTPGGGSLGRMVDEYTWEVDCRDVTLRLTCRQVMMLRDGRRATVRDIR